MLMVCIFQAKDCSSSSKALFKDDTLFVGHKLYTIVSRGYAV